MPNGAWALGWMLAYWRNDPKVGDIVMIRLSGDRMMYLKRVLAVPGERAGFREGQLMVDGRPRPELYVRNGWGWNSEEVRLGPDQYLVAGDRRDMPMSSHAGGVVDRRRIAGRLWLWFGGGQ